MSLVARHTGVSCYVKLLIIECDFLKALQWAAASCENFGSMWEREFEPGLACLCQMHRQNRSTLGYELYVSCLLQHLITPCCVDRLIEKCSQGTRCTFVRVCLHTYMIPEAHNFISAKTKSLLPPLNLFTGVEQPILFTPQPCYLKQSGENVKARLL